MSKLLRSPVAAILLLCAAAMLRPAAAAGTAEFTPEQRQAIEAIVRDYLTKNPDVLLDALQAAEDKMKSDAREKAAKTLAERRRDIFDDPNTPSGGNPRGDVALVEFFDYRCPYCKQVEPALESLLAEDKGLRFVYKELPVLGRESMVAARAALAARKQGKYAAFHTAMMGAKGQIGDDTVYRVAGSVGLDVERLKRDMATPDVERDLSANLALADALDIHGTPAFVIGEQVIPGAVDLASLKEMIADARKK